MNEAENRLAMGSQQLGSIGYGTNSTTQTPMKESTDGLPSRHELSGASALTTQRKLSSISTVEYAKIQESNLRWEGRSWLELLMRDLTNSSCHGAMLMHHSRFFHTIWTMQAH